MNQPKETGGPAFPAPEAGVAHFNTPEAYVGMALRDYFAAKALGDLGYMTIDDDWSTKEIAGRCYELADAMLEARK